MNISLTNELEEYVTLQVKSGHYTSASEVIGEALRNQIRATSNDEIQQRIAFARKQIKERKLIDAGKDCFQNAREYVKKKYMVHPDMHGVQS